MNKKISEKDIKDWQDFINKSEKLEDKDKKSNLESNNKEEKTLDLHGCSLEKANHIAEEFIKTCFSKKIKKITFITGKGTRSKNKDNPYQSDTLSILKYSVPEYIKSNSNLMKLIQSINDDFALDSLDISQDDKGLGVVNILVEW